MKFHQGIYQVKNDQKYIGSRAPRFRSSWELTFMRMCDSHPNVIQWSSEPVRIPYKHPFTGKQSMYVPDFLMIYINKKGRKIAELIEIKPKKQTTLESIKSQQDKVNYLINRSKWMAAGEWAKRKGIRFRVLNEDSIYAIK
jgi:hypothetical protein